ncbi:calcium:proton antiporter [Aquabacter sp. P-9]|uniref:calcium:proton antiporter n=1 Tax=Aquabacter sediminis TaxID=3029197 RepID=UPI00237D8BF9|nr:ionic transporter [Aquabacter sp. P-9]MDE1567207.1 ionic transporter [Aquabacter sp. P-9]
MAVPAYAYVLPLSAVGLALAGPILRLPFSDAAALLATGLLLGSSFSAVKHAERISARLGQPYGTLVLTFSVTLIEVSVLASLMLNGSNNPTLAREAVLSTVMFVLTGVVGICLLLGSLRHFQQGVQQQGVTGFLSVIISISVIGLILPGETSAGMTGTANPVLIALIMVGVVLLYLSFLFMQTVRYRLDYLDGDSDEDERPTGRQTLKAITFLLVSLMGVVMLSDHVAAGVERLILPLNLADPDAVIGAVVVAMLLLPETITAIRAARNNELQRAVNTALGSALATIGLTMPAMVAISFLLDRPIVLGLDQEDRVQLLLALLLSVVNFGTGKTNTLTGMVHLVLFFVYVVTLIVP